MQYTYRCNPPQMRPTFHPNSRQANPLTSARLTSSWAPRYMRKVAEIAAKPKCLSKAPLEGLTPGPPSNTTRSGASARVSA